MKHWISLRVVLWFVASIFVIFLLIAAVAISAHLKIATVTRDWSKFVLQFFSDWSTVLAAGATAVVAVLTLQNIKIANRTLALMESREKRELPTLHLDHLESYLSPADDTREYMVRLRITNPSSAENSVRECNLVTLIQKQGQLPTKLVFPASKSPLLSDALRERQANYAVLTFPYFLKAREAIEGWVIFQIPEKLLEYGTPDQYTLAVSDGSLAEYAHDLGVITPLALILKAKNGEGERKST